MTPLRVLVTGASSGFGLCLAQTLVSRGHRVVATSRTKEAISSLLASAPGNAFGFQLDLTNSDQCRDAVAFTSAQLGGIDVLVNNAGYGLIGALEECTDDQIAQNVATNFTGPLALIRAAIPQMRAQRFGRVVNMGAAAAIINYPGFAAYGGAKAALEIASEAVALECAPFGINVTTVIPGPFRTNFIGKGMVKAANPIADYAPTSGKFATLLNTINGKQPGDPAKAAAAIATLIDPDQTPKPPARLFLGKYAFGKAKKKIENLTAELTASEPLGLATDF